MVGNLGRSTEGQYGGTSLCVEVIRGSNMSGKYIVECGLEGKVKYAVAGCNTIENLREYLEADPHPNYRLVNVQSGNGNYTLVWEERDNGWQALLDAVKMAYRKHAEDDPDVGWSELSEKLGEALSQTMGAEMFSKWLDEIKK